MIKKKKKYDYYKLDVGFFPDVMKLCFDNKVFQQILKDHDVTLKASALDIGIAETHMVGDGRDAVIVLVFDMASVENDGELIDIIAHEVSHAVDHLADHIGEEDNFVGETRAYLTGHLAGQIYKICMSEKEKNARKANRLVLLKQQVFFVELKTETGKLSGRQILVFDQLGEQGFPVYILRSYDDIEEFIREAML